MLTFELRNLFQLLSFVLCNILKLFYTYICIHFSRGFHQKTLHSDIDDSFVVSYNALYPQIIDSLLTIFIHIFIRLYNIHTYNLPRTLPDNFFFFFCHFRADALRSSDWIAMYLFHKTYSITDTGCSAHHRYGMKMIWNRAKPDPQ